MDLQTEKAMLICCLTGEKAAQEAFVRSFSNLVYNTILRSYSSKGIAFQSDDIDDLHNTVFVRLLEQRCKKLRQFKGKNGCSLASWIRIITVRTVIDHLRQSKDVLSNRSMLLGDEALVNLPAEMEEPWQRIDQLEKKKMVHTAISQLQPRDRLFLKLHCIYEAPIAKVAAILKITENTAYSLKSRAIKRLQAIIEKSDYDR